MINKLTENELEKERLELFMLAGVKDVVGSLLGGMVHDLNNILLEMSGNLDLLKLSLSARKSDEKILKRIKRLEQTKEHISQMTEKLQPGMETDTDRWEVLSVKQEILYMTEKADADSGKKDWDSVQLFLGEKAARQRNLILQENLGNFLGNRAYFYYILKNLTEEILKNSAKGSRYELRAENTFIDIGGKGLLRGDYIKISLAGIIDQAEKADRSPMKTYDQYPIFEKKISIILSDLLVKLFRGRMFVKSVPGKMDLFQIYLPRHQALRDKVGEKKD